MTEPRTVILQLPLPPSANNLFPGKQRRFPSKRYKAWQTEALWEVKRQIPGFRVIDGPYHMMLRVNMARRGKIDVANYEKATSDLLVTAGVISDDCNAQIITLHKLPDIIKGGRIEVIVKEAA